MSYLKPDFDYDPARVTDIYVQKKDEKKVDIPAEIYDSKKEVVASIKNLGKGIVDAELHRFYTNTALSVKTSVNVFDSVSFFKKFSDAYIFSIKRTFPDLPESKLSELQEKLNDIEKYLADSLKSGNVENRHLVALSMGLLEGVLNYENY